jgi:RND family efflux transporter MFP subunit
MIMTRGVKFFCLSFFICSAVILSGIYTVRAELITSRLPDMPAIELANKLQNTQDALVVQGNTIKDGLGETYNGIKESAADNLNSFTEITTQTVGNGVDSVRQFASNIADTFNGIASSVGRGLRNIRNSFVVGTNHAMVGAGMLVTMITDGFENAGTYVATFAQTKAGQVAALWTNRAVEENYEQQQMVAADTVADETFNVESLTSIEPAAGVEEVEERPPEITYQFEAEEMTITAEAVLVPREKTVISSSRDGKIAKINFDNGDTFKKGDVLLEYHCNAARAEVQAAQAQRRFAEEKKLTTERLFNLDLISTVEKLESQFEKKRADASKASSEEKYNDCIIKAEYDGRVVKRLANPNEYTRTDRVLIEVASKGTLDAEFLLPSIWLRWVNVGAPLSFIINETGKTYTGKVKRIYGEVDPVSQSIQIRAEMDDYEHPLLPGMSGEVEVDIEAIRSAGIQGFLETGNP